MAPTSLFFSLRRYFARVSFPERTVLATLLLIAGSLWAFIATADEVMEGGTGAFDSWILLAFRNSSNPALPIGPGWLAEAARDMTALGSGTVILLVSAAAMGFLFLTRKRHAMWLMLAAVGGGALLTSVLKGWFGRDRPTVVPHLVEVISLSFPSGHSMLSAITYLTLAALLARTTSSLALRFYCLGLAAVLAFLIGLSRIFLGVHYPTDVLAGWCAGIAWALACSMVARWLQQRGGIEPAVQG